MAVIKIKICGITNSKDALSCAELGADVLGFIFSKVSPRYILPSKAKQIIKQLPPFIVKVGVFVDEKKEVVLKIGEELGLDVLQFHGKESFGFCNFFRPGFKVVKTFFPYEDKFLVNVEKYRVDACLFDVEWARKLKGEKRLKISMLKKLGKLDSKIRMIISGGLTPDNVNSVLKVITPYALDVASGVESFPGKKDIDKVKSFIKNVKCYEDA
ncbi:MAG: phosphoribosylanthranilate isomerase [Candidatus Omnitrophica bacterium]|nr:phosphoribosylanthranilate isomerase [Candidatus Omnitrophota bacterium]